MSSRSRQAGPAAIAIGVARPVTENPADRPGFRDHTRRLQPTVRMTKAMAIDETRTSPQSDSGRARPLQ
jgi:hypothetical protein